ncbi:UNKNOWN [Stylonychia lemnae]|uniref:Uncharacterized protein n=1 Tax=Stylonychia lemnae TaxID=5949 RepID=A0A078ANL5_STYLE|nr:UNKNOWN [Stylonychia lemnae]|eukprot:CDW83526.1 UNKNOWN [Stylonychia lemnae]
MSSRNTSKDEQLVDVLLNDSIKSEKEIPKQDKTWVAYTLAAAILFTTCNTALSEISKLGWTGVIYISPGTLICCITYFTYKTIDEYMTRGFCWTDLNLMDKHTNHIVWRNIVDVIIYCLLYLTIQTVVIGTFGLCLQANLNAGIVSTIWSASPLYSAILDYFFFKQSLNVNHIIGIFSLILCAACISLSNIVGVQALESNEKPPTIDAWIPVTIAVITPLVFAVNGIQIKNMVTHHGFDVIKVNFLCYGIGGVGLFIVLLTKIQADDFSDYYFTVGAIGSIINTLGLVSINKACTIGPLGPVNALSATSTIMFSIVTAIRLAKLPKPLEFVGMFIGIFGALILTVPDYLKRFFLWVTCQSQSEVKQEEKDEFAKL